MRRGIDAGRVDPAYLMELSRPLEDVYEAMEHDLLVAIARRIGKGMSRQSDIDALSWPAKMLAQIGALNEENLKIIARYLGGASEAAELAVRTAVYDALATVEPEMARAAQNTPPGRQQGGTDAAAAPAPAPARSETSKRVMETYARQAVNRQNLVNTVLLNSSLRAYRRLVTDTAAYEAKLAEAQKALNRETGAVVAGAKTHQEAVRAAEGLTGYTDAAGRRWSAQAYAQMDIRTTVANAARQAILDSTEAHGSRLIMVSSHPGARPLCAPWQGRVYSTDGTSGTAHDGSGKAYAFIPLSETSYGEAAGLFGINCGHLPYPFIDGQSYMRYEPTKDAAENDRLYRESQSQRYMERKVRRAKTEADALEAAGDAEGAKAARRKARGWNKELKDWCGARGRSYYPERTRIVRTGTLTKPDQSGTMKLDDAVIPRSLSARTLNYDVLTPDGRSLHFAEGTRIQNREVFAGYGTRSPLHDGVAEGLTDAYGGNVSKWQHVKGIGIIEDNGENVRAEVHWFQEESVGQVKHMIKKWLE